MGRKDVLKWGEAASLRGPASPLTPLKPSGEVKEVKEIREFFKLFYKIVLKAILKNTIPLFGIVPSLLEGGLGGGRPRSGRIPPLVPSRPPRILQIGPHRVLGRRR